MTASQASPLCLAILTILTAGAPAWSQETDDPLATWRAGLSSPEAARRLESAAALAALKDRALRAAPDLLRHLSAKREPSAPVREAAARALLGMGPAIQAPCLAALSQTAPPDQTAILTLLARLAPALDPNKASALASGLTPFLGAGDQGVADQAVETLAALGAPATPSLMAVLEAKGGLAQRRGALRTIAAIGPPAAEALPAVVAALREPEVSLKLAAFRALGGLGPAARPARVELEVALSDREAWIRRAGLDAIGRVYKGAGVEAEELARLMRPLIRDKAPEVRAAAARAFGRFGQGCLGSRAPILRALKDEEKDVRASAAEAALALGEVAVPLLAKALRDDEAAVRLLAAETLGALGKSARKAFSELLRAQRDDDPRVAAAALTTLGGFGYEAVPSLRRGLKDPRPMVRVASALALGRCGPEAETGLPDVLQALEAGPASVRLACAEALGSIGLAKPAVLQALKRDLAAPDLELRQRAAEALALLGAPAMPTLIAALRSGAKLRRAYAAYACARAGAEARLALSALLCLRDDGDPEVRDQAARAVAIVGAARPALEVLVAESESREDERRRSALWFLGDAPAGIRAIRALAEAADDRDAEARRRCCEALSRLGPRLRESGDIREGMAAAVALIGDELAAVRIAALGAAARVGGADAQGRRLSSEPAGRRRAAEAAAKALAAEEPAVREAAESCLAALGADSHEALAGALRDKRADTRRRACVGLARVGAAAATSLPALIQRARTDRSFAVRAAALEAMGCVCRGLGATRARRALFFLKEALGEDRVELRDAAVRGMSAAGVVAVPTLIKALKDRDWRRQTRASQALAAIGPPARPALSALQRLTRAKKRAVREAAEAAIKAINGG